MANSSALPKLFFYGDSHFAAHHFFPAVIRDKVSQSSICKRKFDIGELSIFSLPGKSIDHPGFFERLNTNLSAHQDRSVHILAVGGNSIRDNLRRKQSKEQIVENLRSQFMPLVRRILEQPQAILVVCSLIPSPPHENLVPSCIEVFDLADQMLKQLANEGTRIRYLDLRVTLPSRPGAARVELFADRGRAKDVHLNRIGAEFVCSRIVSCLEHLNFNYFGCTI